jgi:hypothetical protein
MLYQRQRYSSVNVHKLKNYFIHSFILFIHYAYPFLASFSIDPWRCKKDNDDKYVFDMCT